MSDKAPMTEGDEGDVVETKIFTAVTPAPGAPSVVPETTLPPLIYHTTAANLRSRTTLLSFLTTHTDLSEGCIRGLTELGAVYVHHTPSPRRSPRAVRQTTGDLSGVLPGGRVYCRVHAHPKRYKGLYEPFIVYEGGGVVAVHKPPGMPCCAGVDNAVECVTRAVGAGVTTRLDVGTSGVLVMGRDVEAVRRVNALLRRAMKLYLVFCEGGAVEHGVWRDWYRRKVKLGRGQRDAMLRRWDDGGGDAWIHAELEVLDSVAVARGTVVAVRLATGRTHQIRLQMAARGVRVVGDGKYRAVVGGVYDGGFVGGDAVCLGLHCWLLRCEHGAFRADVRERSDLAEFVGDWRRLDSFLCDVEERIRGSVLV